MLFQIESLERRQLLALIPPVFAGYVLKMTVTGATGPFTTRGTYQISFANTGDTYTITGDGKYNSDSSGNYVFLPGDDRSARFTFNDSLIGTANGDIAFTNSTSGTFVLSLPAAGGSQSTTFVVLSPQAQFASLASGLLTVNGTIDNDVIGLGVSSGKVNVTRNGQTLKFAATSVTRVEVLAGDGNDAVSVGAGVVATYVDGGAGNDLLSGGSGNDTLTAGAGKNTLQGNAGDDRLNGSGGRDSLVGGEGADRLYGNGGSDTLDGGGGVDRLFGGDGDDLLLGGSSNDKLYGEAGNDTLNGQKQPDLLDGGIGTDSGSQDGTDSLTSIETVLP